jgi:GTPase-associated system helical domain
MSSEYLMRFLDIGAIDLKGDDSRLEKLRATAKDLSAVLRKAPAKTASFTMVAADPGVASDDPTIQEAMAALRKQWETVSNAFSSPPVAILRAVLLDAIVQAARSDEAISVAFVNTARNALAHAETANEAVVWREAVGEIEGKVDARAEQEWATPEMITVEALEYTPPAAVAPKHKVPTVDRDALQTSIHRSAGPWNGNPSNQYSPHANPQQWAASFAEHMTGVIGGQLDTLAKGLAPAPVDLSGPLTTLATAVTAHVEKALASFSGATAGLQRRTNLLWWKEALYSPSVHESYLDLPAFEAAALMALDLHEQVPTYSPASVSAFLKEAIRCLPADPGGTDGGKQEIVTLVSDARTTEFMQPFRNLAAQYVQAAAGRGPLLSVIGHPQSPGTVDAAALRALAGLDAAAKMTPSDWGTYLFRELQSARATNASAKRPKKK